MSDLNAYNDATNGEYERFHNVTADSRVLDLGAHKGYFSRLCLDRGATVMAFEPHPDNFARLIERCPELGHLAINAAASDKDSPLLLWHCDSNSGAHSIFPHENSSKRGIPVNAVDIGPYVLRSGFVPTFIKVDTEGAERFIIPSLYLSGIIVPMSVEIHDLEIYEHLKQFLNRLGKTIIPNIDGNFIGVCHIL